MSVENPQRQRVILVAEHTPNPHTVRLGVGEAIAPRGGAEFEDPARAERGSPLAARLLELSGVRRILIGRDFVAVTKRPDAAWEGLGERVQAVVRAHLEAGEPVLAPDYEFPARAQAGSEEAAAIEQILAAEIAPALARDGGEVELVDYRDGVLELALRGACADCPSSIQTLRLGIESRLRQAIPGLKRVLAV